MVPIDIKDLLPDPNKDTYEKIKKEHPFNILSRYAKAIGEKYPGKLIGVVAESSDMTSEQLTYSLSIRASIGRGYKYSFLEMEALTQEQYPLKITIFEKYPQEIATVKTSIELEKVLQDIFKMGFTQTLILNLLSQVDIYNEVRHGDSYAA